MYPAPLEQWIDGNGFKQLHSDFVDHCMNYIDDEEEARDCARLCMISLRQELCANRSIPKEEK